MITVAESCAPRAARTIRFCLVGLLSALSSAPLVGTIIGLGLLAYRQMTPGFVRRWRLIGCIMALFAAALFALHNDPFGFIFKHFTLDPETGYYRLLIWQVAGALVVASPLFGIGLDDWARESWMPSTVDSLWLRSAMTFGIVGSLLIALVIIGACNRRIETAPRDLLSDQERSLGVCLSIMAFLSVYLGFTVHFWGSTWILMGLFAGLRAHLGARSVRGR
jgi:O-antigen ligase